MVQHHSSPQHAKLQAAAFRKMAKAQRMQRESLCPDKQPKNLVRMVSVIQAMMLRVLLPPRQRATWLVPPTLFH